MDGYWQDQTFAIGDVEWFAVRTFNAFGTRWLTKQPKSNRAARAFAYLGIGVQDMLETGRLMAPGCCALFVPLEPIEDGLKATEREWLPDCRVPALPLREL